MFDIAVLPVKKGSSTFDKLANDDIIGEQIEEGGGMVIFAQEKWNDRNGGVSYRFRAVFSGGGGMGDEFKPGTSHQLRHDQTGASMGFSTVVANIQDTAKALSDPATRMALDCALRNYGASLDSARMGLNVFK